jgi:hypothetical protein
MKNIRWANSEKIGICYDSEEAVVFVDSGELYDSILAGQYGEVGECFVVNKGFIEPTKAQISAMRQAACQLESDPLFFKWQRGEATQQQWLDKIAEIRARYPNPTDEVPINE